MRRGQCVCLYCLCLCLFVCPPFCLFLSVCLFVSACLSICVCLSLPICMSVCLSICVCLFVSVYLCLSVYVCLTVCLQSWCVYTLYFSDVEPSLVTTLVNPATHTPGVHVCLSALQCEGDMLHALQHAKANSYTHANHQHGSSFLKRDISTQYIY